mgnify:CR=1 FL=1
MDIAPRSSYPSTRRILVTGGAGFVGSHLCERLLGLGHEVLCIDNFFTGRRSNVAHLLREPRFELVRHDITFPLYIEVDEIYNLACPASPIHYQFDPVQTTKTSVLGAINMLGLAKRTRAKILQASTSEVYGDPKVHPQREDYWGHVNPLGPRACYDEGKRCAETLFLDYHRQHRVRIKIARIFNTYGPRMHPNDGRVVSNFIVQALRGEDLTVYGDGSQTRSFCYVDDLVTGLVRLMASPDEVTGPVNLGNPGEFTIKELAQKILNLTGARGRIVHRALPQDDPMQRKPDIALARSRLDWHPEVPLDQGLVAASANPALSGAARLGLDQGVEGHRPGSRGDPGVTAREVGPGNLEVERWLAQCLVLGEDELLRRIPVAGAQAGAFSGQGIHAVERSESAAPFNESEAKLHVLVGQRQRRRPIPNRRGGTGGVRTDSGGIRSVPANWCPLWCPLGPLEPPLPCR